MCRFQELGALTFPSLFIYFSAVGFLSNLKSLRPIVAKGLKAAKAEPVLHSIVLFMKGDLLGIGTIEI